MNKLKLKEFNENHIIYLYQPEGRGEYGEVIYDFADKTVTIAKRAGENSVWHDNKALSKVEECVSKKIFLWNLPKHGIRTCIHMNGIAMTKEYGRPVCRPPFLCVRFYSKYGVFRCLRCVARNTLSCGGCTARSFFRA